MNAKRRAPYDIDEYITGFPLATQKKLAEIRRAIRRAAPRAEEKISYQIPAFALEGRCFVYFAGFARHVSVFPAPRQVDEFKTALAAYKGGKGTVQFPLDAPLPLGLIGRIAKFRLRELQAKRAAKPKAKSEKMAPRKRKSAPRKK